MGISMNFKPLHDRIAVEVIESEEKTSGGIIIPDSAKEKPAQGRVVAVGEGAKDEDGDRISMDIKVGDLVVFGKWSGTEVKVGDKTLLVMKESDVFGIIS
jgi:chaperonin GroES